MKLGKDLLIEELVMWCDVYSRKEHIWTKHLFRSYKVRLLNKGNVTEKMFKHITKYLKWDLKMNDERLWRYFGPIIVGYQTTDIATLEEFL